MEVRRRVAVIGAGPGGLGAVKSCLEEGLEPVCFEQRDAVGKATISTTILYLFNDWDGGQHWSDKTLLHYFVRHMIRIIRILIVVVKFTILLVILFVKKGYGLVSARSQPYHTRTEAALEFHDRQIGPLQQAFKMAQNWRWLIRPPMT